MLKFNVGVNNTHYTASFIIEEVNVFLNYFEELTMEFCGLLMKLPDWVKIPFMNRVKVKHEEGNQYTFAEYYGDTPHDLFHIFICEPVFQFVDKRTKYTSVEIPYFYAKEKFPDLVTDPEDEDFEDMDDDEKQEVKEGLDNAIEFYDEYKKLIKKYKREPWKQNMISPKEQE